MVFCCHWSPLKHLFGHHQWRGSFWGRRHSTLNSPRVRSHQAQPSCIPRKVTPHSPKVYLQLSTISFLSKHLKYSRLCRSSVERSFGSIKPAEIYSTPKFMSGILESSLTSFFCSVSAYTMQSSSVKFAISNAGRQEQTGETTRPSLPHQGRSGITSTKLHPPNLFLKFPIIKSIPPRYFFTISPTITKKRRFLKKSNNKEHSSSLIFHRLTNRYEKTMVF